MQKPSPSLPRTQAPRLQVLDFGFEPIPDFEHLPIPDLLHREPRPSIDPEVVYELLDLAFLGKDISDDLERAMGEALGPDGGGDFEPSLFAGDLFVKELIHDSFILELEGRRHPIHRNFIFRVLCNPPTRADSILFRQQILQELDEDSQTLRNVEQLYLELSNLLSMFKAPEHAAKLDINTFRLDLLKQSKWVIDWMVDGFGHCQSGLKRLYEVGSEIQASEEYRILRHLLDYENHLATLDISVKVGGDGQVKHMQISGISENEQNLFHRNLLRRWWDKLRLLLLRGYKVTNKEMVNRLVREVFVKISPCLTPLVQLVGQLEFYLSSRGFRERSERQGLKMCLATFDHRSPGFTELFNPLLLDQPYPPTPAHRIEYGQFGTTILTGPNSGGKTRLLQAVGLAQLLGQSGLYTAASAANLRIATGLFVSLIERESADQAEGRLGRELIRIRKVFESMRSPAMVIFDELCSGTNPSEGTEIFSMVLRLLDRLQAISFISTHFLEYARQLASEETNAMRFLQVEIDPDNQTTYQFLPGVAESSLATVTAERLGVTFDELVDLIERKMPRAV